VAKRPRNSRYRRLPGAYRFHEKKPPDPGDEPRRLTLYLPDRLLDWAEAQAHRAGATSLQSFCEGLLTKAIEAEHDRGRIEEAEARRGPLEGLAEIANDPEFLADWTASSRSLSPSPSDPARASLPGPGPAPGPAPPAPVPREDALMPPDRPSIEVVFRHAAVGEEDPSAFLPALRRGEPIAPAAAQELLRALADLEGQLSDASSLDRRLAYALHRLAFEGQILLTDSWSGPSADETTVGIVRLAQEAVDRILSGEDIRYFSREPGQEPPL
jgi:hypothetical protein